MKRNHIPYISYDGKPAYMSFREATSAGKTHSFAEYATGNMARVHTSFDMDVSALYQRMDDAKLAQLTRRSIKSVAESRLKFGHSRCKNIHRFTPAEDNVILLHKQSSVSAAILDRDTMECKKRRWSLLDQRRRAERKSAELQ